MLNMRDGMEGLVIVTNPLILHKHARIGKLSGVMRL